MGKNIKKIFKYLIILAGIIFMIPTLLYLLLQIPDLQTFLLSRVSAYISKETNSTLTVGRVEYKFFNRLSVDDLLLKDQNNDTLIYSEKLVAGIRQFDIKNKSVTLGRIILIKPFVGLITDSTGSTNLTYFLNLLKKSADTTAKVKSSFFIDQIDIRDARFSFINHSGRKSKSPVDFNNINLTGINTVIDNLYINDDTTSFNIYNLGFEESSGFMLKRLSADVILAHHNIILNSLNFDCDSSVIDIPRFALISDSADSFKHFTEEVRFDIFLDKSLITTSELRFFIPALKGINESAWISGRLLGTISELRGRDIEVSFRNYTYLDCDFDFSGLPKLENTFMYLGINSIRTNALDIDKIVIPGKGNLIVPDFLYKLENISFDGSFTGFTTDFVTYGELRTNMGSIRTDVSFRPDESSSYKVKGYIKGNEINLGELTGRPELFGKLSMQTNIDGYAQTLKKFAGSLTGAIDSVEINKYLYRNISLNGSFTEKTWDGSVKLSDNNIKLDLLGMFNFEEELPEFHFTLNLADADLFQLHLSKADSSSTLSALITSNFKGSNIDNLDGEIKLINSTLKRNSEVLELYDFTIRTFTENNKPVLSIRTDYVDADFRGHYNFALLGNILKSMASTLLPAKFPRTAKNSETGKNNFTFDINFKNTDKLNSYFRTGLLVADKSYIVGSVITDSLIRIEGRSKLFSFKNNEFKDFKFYTEFLDSSLTVNINSPVLTLMDKKELKDFAVNLNFEPDNFVFTVGWDNKEEIQNRGNFVAKGSVQGNGTRNGIISIGIDSSDIFLDDIRWKISKSSMIIDSNAVAINRLFVSSEDRFYMIDGSVSEDPSDTLHLEFKGIDIAPLAYIEKKDVEKTEKIPLDLKGILNGRINLTNLHRDMLIEGNLLINNFSIFGGSYGNISILSAWDKINKVAKINVSNDFDGIKMFNAAGSYEPRTRRVNLTANTKRLPLAFLNPLLKVFASDIRGLASGTVNLSGDTRNLVLRGSVFAEDASLKVNYLQTRYNMNDTIRFDRKGIKFNNIRLTDEEKHLATLNGSVNHKNFKDFTVDLLIKTNESLVLNTKAKDNKLFFGKAYASGVTTIKSTPNSIVFDISAKTEENTSFNIPLNRGLSVSDYSFITFVDSASLKNIEPDGTKTAPKQTGMDLNFDLEVTPEAEVQLIFDSKVGDVMKGRGAGKLNINLNQKGDFKISGDYIIEEGDYLFTLQNILNKSFEVANGGKITFNGDLDNAEVDINAIYKLRTSLDMILQDSSLKAKIPVECHLNLTGKLFNPIVSFDISLPNADEQTKTNLRNAISTEEALSRQFLYLLVMNSFYADPSYGTATASTTATGTSAMAVTTTEMLSNQLSNWLSQISNDVDLGFVYRPGNKNINPQEVEVALSTQILNDRVTINGNFDVRGNGANTEYTDQITGDFDAEVSITEKIRFKVFNRFNNTYSGKGPYTQGIGIFFRQDFDKFPDLFRKKVKSEMKKEEEPKIKE